jgi:hypothetical protein
MAILNGFMSEQRAAIEARAREILADRKPVACDCGAGELGHSPDCGRVLADERAWDRAVKQAVEEMAGNLVVGADVQYACTVCGAVREVYIPKGKARPRTRVCPECDGEADAIAMFDVAAADPR